MEKLHRTLPRPRKFLFFWKIDLIRSLLFCGLYHVHAHMLSCSALRRKYLLCARFISDLNSFTTRRVGILSYIASTAFNREPILQTEVTRESHISPSLALRRLCYCCRGDGILTLQPFSIAILAASVVIKTDRPFKALSGDVRFLRMRSTK